ncbi:unnamed protein product, partial [Gulo gulo]
PVKPQASAKRKVLQDIKKKSAVSRRGKQCSLVNLDIRAVTTPVTAPMVKEPLNMPRKMPTDLKKAAAS